MIDQKYFIMLQCSVPLAGGCGDTGRVKGHARTLDRHVYVHCLRVCKPGFHTSRCESSRPPLHWEVSAVSGRPISLGGQFRLRLHSSGLGDTGNEKASLAGLSAPKPPPPCNSESQKGGSARQTGGDPVPRPAVGRRRLRRTPQGPRYTPSPRGGAERSHAAGRAGTKRSRDEAETSNNMPCRIPARQVLQASPVPLTVK